MKKFIAIALMLLSITTFAQTPAQEEMVRKEIEKRGLSESEVRSRMSAEGISIDSPEDAMRNQGKIKTILDEMEQEKKGSTTSQNTSTEISSDRSRMMERIEAEKRATEEEAERDQEEVMQTVNDRKIFGRSIFTDQPLGIFRTTDGARAPGNYILGAGDVIRVTIFGSSQTDLLLEVNSQGFIQPDGLPKIFVQGMELNAARNLIIQRLSSYYTFNTDQISVTIQTVRTINVNIFGEVERVGGFNVSALNTALNALSAAGGPTKIGSIRNIELISGKKRRILDVYSVMDNPGDMFQYDLQHNDIIYVPVAQKIVTLNGAVRRPMRYELKEGETLKDLIRFAGGLSRKAYPGILTVQRIEDGEEVIKEYNLNEAMNGGVAVSLQDGDVINIREISKSLERYVEIEGDGSMFYPGRYSLDQTKTLRGLLEKAELRTQAKTDVVFLKRISVLDGTPTLKVIDLDSLLVAGSDIDLQRRDVVKVFTQRRYAEVASISVEGAVRNPFDEEYHYDHRLSVEQALDYAGGLKPGADSKAFVYRRDLFDPLKEDVIAIDVIEETDFELRPGDRLNVYSQRRYMETDFISVMGNVREPFSRSFRSDHRMPLANALSISGGLKPTASESAYVFRRNMANPREINHIPVNLVSDWDFELQPGDRLMVYNQALRERIPQLSVQGEVTEPFTTAFEANMSLTQVLKMAGGVTEKGSRERVEVFRAIIEETQGVRFERIVLKVDEEMNVIEPANFNLQPFDQVVVRSIPQYYLDRSIQISGEVFYPGNYPLETGRYRLSDLIKKAGGLTEQADKDFANIMRAHEGRGPVGVSLRKAMNNQGNDSFDPVLFEDDVITIRRFENVFSINILATRLGLAKRLALKANMQKEIDANELQYTEAELQLLEQLKEPNLAPGQSTELLRQLNLEFINKIDDDKLRDQELETRNFIFRGKRSANWYIKNYAGGYARKADRGSVTVTLPSGQVTGTREYLWGLWRNYPDVVAGAEIALDYKPEKKPKPASEKPDWGSIGTGIAQAVISAVTLILLLQNVN
jgi:protein involved in polysaccharide export with SLBB domain